MNKNSVIKIVSALLAASVLLTAYGCKKGGDKTDENVNQPSIVNSTAVIKYTSVDEKGKEVDVTKIENVGTNSANGVTIGSSLGDSLKDENEKDKFLGQKDDYQLTDEKVEEIISQPAQWSKFTYNFYIANPNPQMMVFANVTADKNNDIIVNTSLGYEQGIRSGNGVVVAVDGLVNTSKYADAEALQEALKQVNVKLVYTLLDENKNNGIDDWSAVTTKFVDVQIVK